MQDALNVTAKSEFSDIMPLCRLTFVWTNIMDKTQLETHRRHRKQIDIFCVIVCDENTLPQVSIIYLFFIYYFCSAQNLFP